MSLVKFRMFFRVVMYPLKRLSLASLLFSACGLPGFVHNDRASAFIYAM